MKEIREALLKTIIFFDLFSLPLKKKEIEENFFVFEGKENFSKEALRKEIEKELQFLCQKRIIQKKEEYYFLFGKEFFLKERKKREEISRKNWQKLKKISKIINLCPFLLGAFVSGSLALDNSKETSDIDLLVITKKGRIFTARFFLFLFLSFFKLYRKEKNKKGKICLNHFFSQDSLSFNFPSLYNAVFYFHLRPIIDRENVFEKFKNKNKWIGNYILFWEKRYKAPFFIKKKSLLASLLEKLLSGKLGDLVEKWLKMIQLKRKEKKYKNLPLRGRVILSDETIELHPFSREREILEEFEKRFEKIKRLL